MFEDAERRFDAAMMLALHARSAADRALWLALAAHYLRAMAAMVECGAIHWGN